MPDQEPTGGDKPPAAKPTSPRETREYTVLVAEGNAEASPRDLDFKVAEVVTASTPKEAKEKALDKNPRLQELLDDEKLWLEAQSGWNPRHVGEEKPVKPKLTGL